MPKPSHCSCLRYPNNITCNFHSFIIHLLASLTTGP